MLLECGGWDRDLILKSIRKAYPEGSASRASDMAVLEPESERWYIYRDGDTRGAAGDDGWPDDEFLASRDCRTERAVRGRE
jgi:hypothetical protein